VTDTVSIIDRARGHAPWVGLVLAAAAAAALIARNVQAPSDRHALLLGGLVALAGAATYKLNRRGALAASAAAGAAAWAIPHLVPRQDLVVALVALAGLAVPGAWLDRRGPALQAGLAAALALVPPLALGAGLLPALGAGALAGLLAWALPSQATRGTLGGLRSAALLGPGALVLLLVPVNTATGWLGDPLGPRALALGIALAALVALVGLAALGLATLLASRSPEQRPAAIAAVASLAALVATVPLRDVDLLAAAGALALAPLLALAATAAGRLDAENPGLRGLPLVLPAVLAILQFGLLWNV